MSDPSAPVGTCTYAAVFSGGNGYASSAASATVTVGLRPTDLTLEVKRGTGRDKKLVYLTAHLGGWHSNNVVTLTAQPAGGTEIVLASGSVDSAGYLSATYQPKTTTTYRARYAGDDWYRDGVVARTQ